MVLSESESVEWESWRSARVAAKLPVFMQSIAKMAPTATDDQQFILQELQLWAESIAPIGDG